MSLIGPRPLLVRYLPYYTEEERRRHCIRPGITGLAQVNGRNGLAWDDRLGLDVKYVDNMSLILDIKILVATVMKVVKSDGVKEDVTKDMLDLDQERKFTCEEI